MSQLTKSSREEIQGKVLRRISKSELEQAELVVVDGYVYKDKFCGGEEALINLGGYDTALILTGDRKLVKGVFEPEKITIDRDIHGQLTETTLAQLARVLKVDGKKIV